MITYNDSSKFNSQLAQIEQQLQIPSNYIFADTTARDAYFTTNPTELTEGLFIVVGTVFQKNISGTWTNITSLISSFNDVMTVEGEAWEVV